MLMGSKFVDRLTTNSGACYVTDSRVFQRFSHPIKCCIWGLVLAVVAAKQEIRWKAEEDGVSQYRKTRVIKIPSFPSRWMILTGAIMLTMWRVGTVLSSARLTWTKFDAENGPFHISQKVATMTQRVSKHDKLALIMKDALQAGRSGLSCQSKESVVALKALKIAEVIASRQPVITMLSEKKLRDELRIYKRGGQLMTGRVSESHRNQILQVLDNVPQGLLNSSDSFEVIVDTGCTRTSTGFQSDFKTGSLTQMANPLQMDGIAGGLTITHTGMVRYEALDDKGEVVIIETPAYFIPKMSCRLFSPQAHFRHLQESGQDSKNEGELRCNHQDVKITLPQGQELTIQYDDRTHLPRLRGYHNARSTAGLLSLVGCVSMEANQNLTMKQKLLLRWHYRLGHVGFATVKWLGGGNWLGDRGKQLTDVNLDIPKCAACQYGKQGKTPTPGRHVSYTNKGALTKNVLRPGELIFSDQYESRVLGRSLTSKGMVSSSVRYTGGTIFVDAASGFVFVGHQVGSTATETIASKIRFEREALSSGVAVNNYHTDNGIYNSKEFMRELAEKGQGIKFSGVSAQFQNGVAESAIRGTVRTARTMMIHASIRWPGYAEKDLWPMALSHAAYLHNITPNISTGVAPLSVFTGTTQSRTALLNSHPWGCPVYVLQPKLKEGQKIPKWEPRSKRGQYMGNSPFHASTVGLVRNLQTGSITPQFHLVYDDFFETVTSNENDTPESWQKIFELGRFRSDYDEESETPELQREWLNSEEMKQRDDSEKLKRSELEGQGIRDTEIIESGAEIEGSPNLPVISSDGGIEATDATETNVPNVSRETTSAQDMPSVDENRGRPTRARKAPDRFGSSPNYNRYYKTVAALCFTTAKSLVGCSYGQESDFRYLVALMTDPENGALDGIHPGVQQYVMGLKASKSNDPDLPTYTEAMNGAHKEEYEDAMDSEAGELIAHKTWNVVAKSDIPSDAKILPSTWVLRAKRYPDGRLRKFKARFCVRGDQQVEGIDYQDKYSPVVSWATVRMMLVLAISQNLTTRQVDFSNAFVQAMFKAGEHIYQTDGASRIHGPGQGARASPGIWAIISCLLMECIQEKSNGIEITCPKLIEVVKFFTSGFVDDVTLWAGNMVRSLINGETPEMLLREMQQAAQWWEQLLYATGGKLELSK